jgi:hypothetical protein
LALAHQFLSFAQLQFRITTGHDLPQMSLAEGGDFQWSRRTLKVVLDLLWQLKQVHELGHATPREPFSGGDFALVIPELHSISWRERQACPYGCMRIDLSSPWSPDSETRLDKTLLGYETGCTMYGTAPQRENGIARIKE